MTDRELMQQALDALEFFAHMKSVSEDTRRLITALRERLAQPEPVKFNCTVVDDDHPEGVPLSQWGQQQKQKPFCYHDGRNIVGKEYAHHCDVFPLYTEQQPEQEPLTDERIESVRHMRNVQGYDGNWNYDPYMQGLYNGLEFALSLLEVRQPEFKDAPATWIGDIRVNRDKLSSAATQDIKVQE